MVIIDTLARNFGDGDENSAKDMGEFISNVSNEIRVPFECAVVIVHHSGHAQDRARGSSALRAAVDAEYQVKAFGGGDEDARLEVTCTKMKDDAPPPVMKFKLQPVLVRKDADDGEEIAAAGLVIDENPFDWALYGSRGGDKKVLARDLMEILKTQPETTTSKVMLDFGVKLPAAKQILKDAISQGLVEVRGKGQASKHVVLESALKRYSLEGGALIDGRAAGLAAAAVAIEHGLPDQEEPDDASEGV
jgi:hypothetical protein